MSRTNPLIAYVQGHRIALTACVAWGVAAVSLYIGDAPLRLPRFFQTTAGNLTVDAALALLLVAALTWSLTSPLAWFEERSTKLWRAADIAVLAAILGPLVVLSTTVTSNFTLMRNVGAYLVLVILIAVRWSTMSGITVAGLWLLAQAAFLGASEGQLHHWCTIVLQPADQATMFGLLAGACAAWGILGGAVKLKTLEL